MKKNQIGHVIVERQILSALSNRGKVKPDDKKEIETFPFIVRLYFAFQTRTHLFLVMDFVPGGDLLSRLVKHGRLTLRLSTIYAAEVFLALDYLHKLGIIYRDMKPENLLITSDGHLKLADFGVSYIHSKGYAGSISPSHKARSPRSTSKSSRRRGEEDGPCSFVGTEIYMAPELISQAIRARRKKKSSARASKPYVVCLSARISAFSLFPTRNYYIRMLQKLFNTGMTVKLWIGGDSVYCSTIC